VKAGRYEASVSRATLNKGIVKGRASLANAGDGIEIKGQSTFEQLDVAALLADFGLLRSVSGSAQGQVAFEGTGDSPAQIVHTLNGRATMTLRQGEFVGLGLTDMLRRAEVKSDGGPVPWRGGRTPFDQATLHMTVADGVAEIVDARLTSTGIRAALQGRSSLARGTLAAKASVKNAAAATSAALFDITGPWSALTVVPGAHTLSRWPDADFSAAVR
jgi:AsmA protein